MVRLVFVWFLLAVSGCALEGGSTAPDVEEPLITSFRMNAKSDEASSWTFRALPDSELAQSEEQLGVPISVNSRQIYALDLWNPRFDTSLRSQQTNASVLKFESADGEPVKPQVIEGFASTASLETRSLPAKCLRSDCQFLTYYTGLPLEGSGDFLEAQQLLDLRDGTGPMAAWAGHVAERLSEDELTEASYVLQVARFMPRVRLFMLFAEDAELNLVQRCVSGCGAD